MKIKDAILRSKLESKSKTNRFIKEWCIPLKCRVKKWDLHKNKYLSMLWKNMRESKWNIMQCNEISNSAFTRLTALIINAAMDPNPTREFIFGEPFENALRPSTTNSATDFVFLDQWGLNWGLDLHKRAACNLHRTQLKTGRKKYERFFRFYNLTYS